ncbi:hypothetical protein MC885_005713 [Smutsia gigantea]|nr:hypothetical protein MC885_005713 [Smutsia gigantea]
MWTSVWWTPPRAQRLPPALTPWEVTTALANKAFCPATGCCGSRAREWNVRLG